MTMPSQLQEIKQENQDVDLIDCHYSFCRRFGYISPEEFGKMKIPAFVNLMNRLNEESDSNRKEYEKSKKGGRR